MKPIVFISLLCCLGFVTTEPNDLKSLTKGAELLLTFVVHRHGDRTPVSAVSEGIPQLSDDPERDQRLSFPFGEGGLTNEGKLRGYYIGEYLKERYSSLLSNIYFQDEIYLRSTNIERSKMTLLTALAALYPPVNIQRWNLALNWQPIPYTTLPESQDFVTFFYSCAKGKKLMDALYTKPIPEVNAKYGDLLDLLTENLSFNFTKTSSMVYLYNDLVVAQDAIGVSAPKWIAPYLNELYDAASIAIKAIFQDDQVRRISGGVFLNEFFRVADDIVAGKNVNQRVRIYSAHDINVASQLAAGLLPVVAPKYGSVLSLELYKLKKTGKYFVVPVYLPQSGNSRPKILPIEGCGYLCSYDKYRNLTANYTLTEEQFREECDA